MGVVEAVTILWPQRRQHTTGEGPSVRARLCAHYTDGSSEARSPDQNPEPRGRLLATTNAQGCGARDWAKPFRARVWGREVGPFGSLHPIRVPTAGWGQGAGWGCEGSPFSLLSVLFPEVCRLLEAHWVWGAGGDPCARGLGE